MVKRTYSKDYQEEPDDKKFDLPSEKEHLFQVVEVFDNGNNPFEKGLDLDTVCAKCEVVGGDEEGRALLQRSTLDETHKGFFATRLLLKAIGEPYKGNGLEIDTDRWVGRQFYATVVHNGKYANISEYNYDKVIEQYKAPVGAGKTGEVTDIAWEE